MPRMPGKPLLRYLCRASLNGQTIAGPHPDPNEVERLAWEVIRERIRRYRPREEWPTYKAEREMSLTGGVRLLVRGLDTFPVEIVFLSSGLFEVEE